MRDVFEVMGYALFSRRHGVEIVRTDHWPCECIPPILPTDFPVSTALVILTEGKKPPAKPIGPPNPPILGGVKRFARGFFPLVRMTRSACLREHSHSSPRWRAAVT
jgi:hypothetical protein